MNYNDFGLKQRDWENILDTLAKYNSVASARIFGSRAKGNYKPGSDIDLVLIGENVTREEFLKISYELNEVRSIPFTVDVVIFSNITKPELKLHIETFGVEIYRRLIE